MNEVAEKLTHKALVARAVNWLRGSQACGVVLRELKTIRTDEIADVIGFKGANSILLECKASRADFLADRHKPFRAEGQGMGDTRYFVTPPGLLKENDLPQGWGLIEVHPYRLVTVVAARGHVADKHEEVGLLMSVIRRLEISAAVFVQAEGANAEVNKGGEAP